MTLVFIAVLALFELLLVHRLAHFHDRLSGVELKLGDERVVLRRLWSDFRRERNRARRILKASWRKIQTLDEFFSELNEDVHCLQLGLSADGGEDIGTAQDAAVSPDAGRSGTPR